MSEKDMLVQMLQYLKDISYFKYKKLQKLACLYVFEEDPYLKEKADKKLNRFIYNLYLSCMNKSTRDEISNTGVLINEECYNLEQRVNYHREKAPEGAECQAIVYKNKKQWRITFDGAYCFEEKDDDYIITGRVPREYYKGFYLRDDSNLDEENFYIKNLVSLNRIADYMDRKQELTTYDYQTKNPFIPIEFIELLVDYLGLSKIPENEKYNKKS